MSTAKILVKTSPKQCKYPAAGLHPTYGTGTYDTKVISENDEGGVMLGCVDGTFFSIDDDYVKNVITVTVHVNEAKAKHIGQLVKAEMEHLDTKCTLEFVK